MSEENKFKVSDRVKRVKGGGCFGTVKDVRAEISTNKSDTREKPIMIGVLWDNGTLSYFAPAALSEAS